MKTRHINYKSDFVIRERFRNGAGAYVALPDVDFVLRYWVGSREVIASRQNGVFSNCVPDGDALLVMFKNHGLGEGELKHELHLSLDNTLFSDGVQNVYYPERLNVILWDKMGDTEGVIESDCVAAYTRGYKFTWEDFTAANIEELQRPAVEAAARADKATQSANAATQASKQATGDAIKATTAANVAAREAAEAAEVSQTATSKAVQATGAAEVATRQADAATEASQTATRNAVQATGAAEEATERAEEAATRAGVSSQQIEATRTQMQEIISRAELVVAGVPTGLKVDAPTEITFGNIVPQFIRAQVKPDGVAQNVIFQTRGGAIDVEPDGHILVNDVGESRVHIIPTQGVQHYRTIKIAVVPARIRLGSERQMRIDRNGNIRLT